MPKLKINKRNVNAVAQGSSDTFYWDTELTGFGLKVTKNGSKSYVVQYRMGGRGTPARRYNIGKHGAPWTPDQARSRAQELLIAAKSGRDPAEEERQANLSARDLAFNSYVSVFVERYAKTHQQRSWKQTETALNYNAVPVLRAKPINKITRRDIASLIEKVGETRPATSRQLHAILRKLFRWAAERGDLEISPMVGMSAPPAVRARDRVLSDTELAAVWHASMEIAFPFGPMTRLLIATGQRRSEVSSIRWSDVDLDASEWVIPAALAKNGIAHVVPLNSLAVEELRACSELCQSDIVFSSTGTTAPSGWSKPKAKLDQKASDKLGHTIPHWKLHDLRRTFATAMQRLGVRFEVTEALLNHVSGAKSGVAGVYQRYDWASEKRLAMTAWADGLQRLIFNAEVGLLGKPSNNILPFAEKAS
ncbi:MAG: tyrosine-type recombinase/integrase [Erythrobacter sp.]|uniref:tyrosine-type recombinase/integrase n=1 Tax=Parasphingorhabdus sp. TaxID=2709688 RepID=UPI00326DF1F5